jgi:hypothetical protein
VIDPIDDDPDGACDCAEPELKWADCPILPRGEMLTVIERDQDSEWPGREPIREEGAGAVGFIIIPISGPHLYRPARVTM